MAMHQLVVYYVNMLAAQQNHHNGQLVRAADEVGARFGARVASWAGRRAASPRSRRCGPRWRGLPRWWKPRANEAGDCGAALRPGDRRRRGDLRAGGWPNCCPRRNSTWRCGRPARTTWARARMSIPPAVQRDQRRSLCCVSPSIRIFANTQLFHQLTAKISQYAVTSIEDEYAWIDNKCA